MESIRTVLGHSPQPTPTPKPENSGDQTLTRQEISETDKAGLLEQLRLNLYVSSLSHTFENFKLRPGSQAALAAFRTIAQKQSPPLLLCIGLPGSGKTFLMEALCLELYRRGTFIRLLTASGLLSALKRCMEPGHMPTYEEQLRRYMEEPRLLIDDLGAGSTGSDWQWGVWEAIISYRYGHRLMTVITTNLDISQIPERIVSRFADKDVARTVLNKATDYRREGK